MLILTRRIGETLNIGDDVRVTVLGIKGNQVRIGVSTPRRDLRKDKERTGKQRQYRRFWRGLSLQATLSGVYFLS